MDKEVEHERTIFIGMNIASFLVNTKRVPEAVELCKECLILLNSKDLLKENEFVKTVYPGLYLTMFTGYLFISDYTSAIECGTELLGTLRGCDEERTVEGAVAINLAWLYKSQNNYEKTEQLYKIALDSMTEIGDRQLEAICHENLADVYTSLGENAKAEESHEKALAIRKEICDREGEAADYSKLAVLFESQGKYVKAEESYEKALAIRKEIGDREGEAADCSKLGVLFESQGKYVKAKEYLEKSLAINKEIGNRKREATCYGNLGNVLTPLGEYVKAREYFQEAVEIRKEIGDRKGEATAYGNLSVMFISLGEYGMAEEYLHKALEIRKVIGDRKGETADYANLGLASQHSCEYVKAEAYLQKALTIQKETGDRQGEASCYRNLGVVYRYLSEYTKAEKYLKKALSISQEMGDRHGQARDYGNLGAIFQILGEHSKAKECSEKALAIAKDSGDYELELRCRLNLAYDMLLEGNKVEAISSLLSGIKKCEDVRSFLMDYDHFKISLLEKYDDLYRMLSEVLFGAGYPNKSLCVVELGRARALADLMSAQYFDGTQISVDPQSWLGIERIMEKQADCTCLYISYFTESVLLWILKAKKPILFKRIGISDVASKKGLVRSFDDLFGKDFFREFNFSPQEDCEDRSLFPLNGILSTRQSQREDKGRAPVRAPVGLKEEKTEEDPLDPQTSLAMYHEILIAPVADLLEEPEIIVVPDRSLYKVPFAALKKENGKCLSETLKIRIVPSLTTLKLIQDRPADQRGDTGALIVGDPDVSHVISLSQLPCARKEAEMIGRLLRVEPLLGHKATKLAVLEMMHSASLIHIAAHGNAERGEIALAPVRPVNRILHQEDFVLTMSDVAQVQLRAKLVVLSCCHSGRGQVKSEGVVGIARAFLGSGARSVLVALWALNDEATEQLISRFYKHLVRGESASESLHQTMKWMRGNGYSDVRQWAPFMLIGDNVTFNFGK